MNLSVRSVSHLLQPCLFKPLCQNFSIQRKQIPPAITQRHHYHSWIKKALEAVTGIKPTTPTETKQAIYDHQKLWVAHYSIHNDAQTHEHYEMFYSMQLFENPKDFSVQQYYTALVDKEKDLLSKQELQEIVHLYQFAIGKETSLFTSMLLEQKLKTYLSILRKN